MLRHKRVEFNIENKTSLRIIIYKVTGNTHEYIKYKHLKHLSDKRLYSKLLIHNKIE